MLKFIILRFERILMALAILSIVAIMVFVATDAISRYLFNSPLSWSFELVSYYLVVIATYFMISATLRHGDHISIAVVRNLLPRRGRAFVDILWSILAGVVFVLMAYAAMNNMGRAWVGNNFFPGIIPWPVWLTQLPIFIGTLSLVLSLALNIVIILTGEGDPYGENEGDLAE